MIDFMITNIYDIGQLKYRVIIMLVEMTLDICQGYYFLSFRYLFGVPLFEVLREYL